jgi:hypothetical protein
VAAISSTDVWAVGAHNTIEFSNPIIEHWDGNAWSLFSLPFHGSLIALTAISANDVWAVGNSNPQLNVYDTLVEHWDGKSWSIVNSPNISQNNNLLGIVAASANDIWAVGVYFSNEYMTLIEHWNGKHWSVVKSPNPRSSNSILFGIACIPGTAELWAVGQSNPQRTATLKTLTEFSG